MKTAKQPISNASFITPILRLFLNNLQRKESVKKATLFFFVMVCILIRYTVLRGEKNLVPYNKPASVTTAHVAFSIWPSAMIFKRNSTQNQLNSQFKLSEVDFRQNKTDPRISNVNSKRL